MPKNTPPNIPYIVIITQTLGDKVDNIMQADAPILPIIIIIRQPYLLARPDTIGPLKKKYKQCFFWLIKHTN
jgi:hypothetical protein